MAETAAPCRGPIRHRADLWRFCLTYRIEKGPFAHPPMIRVGPTSTGQQHAPPPKPTVNAKTLGNCTCPPPAAAPADTTAGQTPLASPIRLLGNFRPVLVSVADPITLGTGNVFESATDYTTAGQNPLAFTRSYNSMASPSGTLANALGTHWRSNYDRFLSISSQALLRSPWPQLSLKNSESHAVNGQRFRCPANPKLL